MAAILWRAVHAVDLSNPESLCKEEAFFDTCNRYDAQTEFFDADHNYFSGVVPDPRITSTLKPYTDYVCGTLFPDHMVFRCQVVRNIPGKCIKPHIDPRIYHEYSHRVHAVLQTNDGCGHVYFDESAGYKMDIQFMPAGFIYDFDNITPHSAFNLGPTDRIHVITDVIPREFVTKHRVMLTDNPNIVRKGVRDSYYQHVAGVTARYGDDSVLRAAYLKFLQTGVIE